MIARTWRGRTPAAKSDEYMDVLQRTGLKEYAATDGNRGVLVLRRLDGDQAEFLLITLWESWEAIKRFAGDDVERSVYYPEDDAYLLEREAHVTHYEVMDEAGFGSASPGQH